MPEGHTIHRIAKDLSKRMLNHPLQVSSPQGRFRAESRVLDGQKMVAAFARGKHLFCRWEDEQVMHVHLGLYGKLRFRKVPLAEPRGQVRVRMIGASYGIDLNGPNQCELISQDELEEKVSRLGVDPLDNQSDPDIAWERISRSRAAIATLLLNQSVIAGVGNVYRCEALFHLGLPPDLPGKELSRKQFQSMWQLLRNWLQIGVKYNRIITVDTEEIGTAPSKLKKAERLLIYKKDVCPQCDAGVRTETFAARKLYFCPVCQASNSNKKYQAKAKRRK